MLSENRNFQKTTGADMKWACKDRAILSVTYWNIPLWCALDTLITPPTLATLLVFPWLEDDVAAKEIMPAIPHLLPFTLVTKYLEYLPNNIPDTKMSQYMYGLIYICRKTTNKWMAIISTKFSILGGEVGDMEWEEQSD